MRPRARHLLACSLILLTHSASAADFGFRMGLPGDEDDYSKVLAIAGRTLVVGNYENEVTVLLDARTGALRATLPCPVDDPYQGDICVMAVAASHRLVAVGGTSFVHLYDHGGRLLRQLSGVVPPWAGFGRAVDLRGNRLLVGAPLGPDGGSAHLFDALRGRLVRTIANPEPATSGFGSRVLLVGRVAIVLGSKIWAFDSRTGALLWTRPHAATGLGAGLARVGRDLVVSGGYRLRGDTGEVVLRYTLPSGEPATVVGLLAAGGGTVAVAHRSFGENGGVHLFDARTGAFRETIEEPLPHTSEGIGAELAAGGRYLGVTSGTFSGDGTLFGFRH